VDVMLAGGVEAMINDMFFASFEAMRAVTTRNDEPERASRPFDAQRDGFVIGEGTAIFVLEGLDHALARGARIYAEVLGWSETADAFHIAQPDPSGRGAALAMRTALADAGLTPADIDYINPHAAGTPLGDAHETTAIKDVFGPRAYQIPISSTKSMIGHLFGGAGAAEALACLYTIHTGIVHPTINYEFPDPECDLDYVPNVARQAPVNITLSNSFGLGGQNACLIMGKCRP
jgi:3-oxoacyl-[acyl-carrier-protein] synthase II